MEFEKLSKAAIHLSRTVRFTVHYHSSRSDEKQSAEGFPYSVGTNRDNDIIVCFERDDGQKMKVISGEGKLLSLGSHAPITGYAFKYEVEKEDSEETVNAETLKEKA
jgi:hypothetical protein